MSLLVAKSDPVSPSSSPFEGFDVRLDPWSVDYGAELPAASDREEPAVEVDPYIEAPRDGWQARSPLPSDAMPLPDEVVFVDGVRRLELRVIVPRGPGGIAWAHGAFGSWGVGAVIAGPPGEGEGRMAFGPHEVGRCLVVGSGVRPPARVVLGPGLAWDNHAAEGDEADVPPTWVHRKMREAEESFARRMATTPAGSGRLVVSDGPLSFVDRSPASVLGLVKRLHEIYLPDALVPVLQGLTAGQRTPLVALQGTAFPRYTWFVRLADPAMGEPPLSGLVRVEAAIGVGREETARLADLSAIMLPRYVPARARDARAPQNLLAIGALEAHLRRQLGDQTLLRRHLETLVRGAARPTPAAHS
ncbi:MAG: hypothetical protein IT385_12330 [Deltaproteobacteria bacterium]|nr:hypothetical protein [Deltaproteobacteria bacterium]